MWSKILAHFPLINQRTDDPNAPPIDSDDNCGCNATAMIAGYIAGYGPKDTVREFDPERIRLDAGEGPGYSIYPYTDWGIDRWFWSHRVKVRTRFHNATSKADMVGFLSRAIRSGHAVKGLFYFSAPGSADGHFRAVIGSFWKIRKLTRMWVTANPWTGERWDQSTSELWAWSQNQWLEVMAKPKPKGEPKATKQEKDALKRLSVASAQLGHVLTRDFHPSTQVGHLVSQATADIHSAVQKIRKDEL